MLACTESPTEFDARRCGQQYRSYRSVCQYESHRLSGSLLSSLLVQTPSSRLQQVTPVRGYTVSRPVYAKAQAMAITVTIGLLTRHACCHASLLRHHDVDADSPRTTEQRLSEVESRLRPACLLGSMFSWCLSDGAFEIRVAALDGMTGCVII